jgi:histidinol phosphatase-like PHP family hydrolase
MAHAEREPFPWLRQVRDEDYDATKEMTPEEMIAYYREKAAELHAELGIAPRIITPTEPAENHRFKATVGRGNDQVSRSDAERFPWLRQARHESYEKTKDMTPEEMVEYYHREAQEARKELEPLIREKARQLDDRSEQPTSA